MPQKNINTKEIWSDLTIPTKTNLKISNPNPNKKLHKAKKASRFQCFLFTQSQSRF